VKGGGKNSAWGGGLACDAVNLQSWFPLAGQGLRYALLMTKSARVCTCEEEARAFEGVCAAWTCPGRVSSVLAGECRLSFDQHVDPVYAHTNECRHDRSFPSLRTIPTVLSNHPNERSTRRTVCKSTHTPL